MPIHTLAAWLHDIDPIAFGPVRWYGLSYIAGFVIAYFMLRAMAMRGMLRIPAQAVLDALLALVIGVLVGGRLGSVIFYNPHLITEFTSSVPFWGVLAINKGGMASHGGMVGVILACWWIARVHKLPMLHVADMMALVAPVGLMLGRIANFVNGELLGRIVARPWEEAPWWAVKFPQELGQRTLEWYEGVNPDTRAAMNELTIAYLQPEDAASLTEIERVHAVSGFVTQSIQQGVSVVSEQIEPLLNARHPSQLYQAFFEGVVLFVVLWAIAWRARKPGVIGSWFLIVYGAGRIFTEFYRLPDVGVSGFFPGLSRGQSLSALMIVAGFGLLAWVCLKSDQPRMGGWLRRPEANEKPAPARAETGSMETD
ncbi:MAG: prolipoprotein diacylglyceryl transferase [Phycisphaerales bacterium JB065]